MKLTKAQKKVLEKFGEELARKAYDLHEYGNGAYGVAFDLGVTYHEATALIGAGKYLKIFIDLSKN